MARRHARQVKVEVWVSPQTAKRLTEDARRAGLSRSAFIRVLLRQPELPFRSPGDTPGPKRNR